MSITESQLHWVADHALMRLGDESLNHVAQAIGRYRAYYKESSTEWHTAPRTLTAEDTDRLIFEVFCFWTFWLMLTSSREIARRIRVPNAALHARLVEVFGAQVTAALVTHPLNKRFAAVRQMKVVRMLPTVEWVLGGVLAVQERFGEYAHQCASVGIDGCAKRFIDHFTFSLDPANFDRAVTVATLPIQRVVELAGEIFASAFDRGGRMEKVA
jgi:hypothetical protein